MVGLWLCKVREVPRALLLSGMPIFSPSLICNLATDVEILLNFVSLGGKNETFLSQILSTVSQFSMLSVSGLHCFLLLLS